MFNQRLKIIKYLRKTDVNAINKIIDSPAVKCLGFTLAETLITLGIIGVVAAITIPNLIQKNYEKIAVNRLIQTQSILSQALKMATDEYGEPDGWDLSSTDVGYNSKILAERLFQFMKPAHICGLTDTDGYCTPAANYKMLFGYRDSNNYRTSGKFYSFVLKNGASVWTYAFINSNKKPIIWFYVDINGKYLPNGVGKDLFLFTFRDNALFPSGASDSDYPYKTNCGYNHTLSWGCTYYVVHNKNMNYLHNK